MPIRRSYDANPDHVIPRMTLDFIPEEVGEAGEFILTAPVADVESATPLPKSLEYMPEIDQATMTEIIANGALENEAGKVEVNEAGRYLHVKFGFTPLPPKVQLPDGEVRSYWERFRLEQKDRMPVLMGRRAIFESIAKITATQYQFGIPIDQADDRFDFAAARLSFVSGDNPDEPRVIITDTFEAVRTSIDQNTSEKLTLMRTTT